MLPLRASSAANATQSVFISNFLDEKVCGYEQDFDS
jgi:hypothetical protein